jgi:pantetheine-phosphate adenylyltransferase
MLTVEARKRLIERVYENEERVEVTTYTTLTGDEARRVGARTIIRSVRNATDFDYERTMDHANRAIYPELRTVVVIAPAEVEHISSSLVRELHAFGHDTSSLLPEGVTLTEYLEK